jgi:signal transduction histidine kinase
LAWVTGLRLVVLFTLFVATSFFYLRVGFHAGGASQRTLLATFGAGFALATAYGLILRRGRHLTRLAFVQLACDQLTWTAFVYVSGGAASGATLFYALSALVGAALVGRRGAMFAAALGVSCYVVVSFALARGLVLPPTDQDPASYPKRFDAMAYPMLINIVGVLVVAVLSGYLAERLRTTGGRLERAEERAVAAERLATLGRVAAGLAHEIRNPLGSIRGSIELLRDSPALSDEDRELCDIVNRESARLEELVNDMVNLSRPRPPSATATSIAQLAQEVVSLASKNERRATTDVRVAYVGPDLGAFALCDPAQMRQVLWNLLRNAIQVSQAGSSVEVRVEEEAERITLAVRDEGPGVDDEAKARIFDAFYTTRTQGAGLGLAVVKRILDDHRSLGVTLRVTSPVSASVPPGGTEFRVSMPRRPQIFAPND